MTNRQKTCADDKTIKEIFFSTKGRLNRWRYFKRRMVISVLSSLTLIAGYEILGYEFNQVSTVDVIFNGVVTLLFLIPTTCLNIRRLQDMNKGKTLAAVFAILMTVMAFSDFTLMDFAAMNTVSAFLTPTLATVSMLMNVYLFISPGTYGKNKYGEDPLDVGKVSLQKQN